jgi:hypothetical protein
LKQLRDGLYQIVVFIARIHDNTLVYNRSLSSPFTDKQLHFLFLGAFGLLLFLAAWPVFRALTRRGCAGLMAWLFALPTVISVCFAIEIGQYLTNTGSMQLEDIVSGILGFLAVSAVIMILWLIYRVVRWIIRKVRRK